MTNRINLPEKTRQRLEQLVRQREQLSTLINATVLAVREALDVPEGYVLRSLDEGFVEPEKPQE